MDRIPTDAQIAAGIRQVQRARPDINAMEANRIVRDVWQAMVDAAPQPTETHDDGPQDAA